MNTPKAAYVGRFSLLHLGHEEVIKNMIKEFGIENCHLIIGSVGHVQSMRHLFSFEERYHIIKTVFPELTIHGIPDYPTDDEWIFHLNNMLENSTPAGSKITYYGGCQEDIEFYIERNYQTKIMNRYDGTTPKVSATEMRDALVMGRSLENIVNQKIMNQVKELFTKNWEIFKKK